MCTVYPLALSILVVFCGQVGEAADSGQQLTVEETVGAVFLKPRHGIPYNVYKNANRDAKPHLYEVLRNKNLENHHAAALLMLGYVGDAADVSNIERDARTRYNGTLTQAQWDAMAATCDCLGLMLSRGVDEAQSALKKMATLEYWEGIPFKWYRDDVLANKPGLEYEGVAGALHGYSLSGKGDLKQVVQGVLEGIKNPKARDYVTGRIDPERLAREAELVRLAEKQPLTPQMLEVAAKAYTERAGEIVGEMRQSDQLSQDDRQFVLTAVKEAQEHFDGIKAAITNGESGKLAGCLLDNGQKIPEEKVKRLWAQYEKDLSREQVVFEALAERKSSPTGFCVEKTLSYKLPLTYDEKAAELKADKREAVEVVFMMKNSGEIGNVMFSRVKGSLTVAQDGTLLVIMKKLDGEWHWNPFGW
jgi:hypothetical protein